MRWRLPRGWGAIGNTLLSVVEAGDTVLAGDVLNGGTNLLLRQHLPRLGVRVEFVDVTDLGLVERALERSPKDHSRRVDNQPSASADGRGGDCPAGG